MNKEQQGAFNLLQQAGLFYMDSDETDDEDYDKFKQMLNMSDVWCWACADGEDVPDEELIELKRLFCTYGRCGVLYWVSKRNDNMRSEFYNNNRYIEFVENEERIRKEYPGSSERAYHKTSYTITGGRKNG